MRVCGGKRGPAWDVGSFRSHSRPKPCVGSAPNLPSDAVAAGIARDRVKLGWIRANRFGCAKRTGQAGSVSSEFSNLPGGRRRAQCRPLPAQARPRELGLGAASFPHDPGRVCGSVEAKPIGAESSDARFVFPAAREFDVAGSIFRFASFGDRVQGLLHFLPLDTVAAGAAA